MSFLIRHEASEDGGAVDALISAAFGPGRFAKSAYRLREGVSALIALSHVAVADGKVVGTIRYWPIVIGSRPALLLGPIAVSADKQGLGIALALMQDSLAAAKQLGHEAVILVGDEPYYARAGFKRVVPEGRIRMPGPVNYARLLGLSLVDEAMEKLEGEVMRFRLDQRVAAAGAGLSAFAVPAEHQTAHDQQKR